MVVGSSEALLEAYLLCNVPLFISIHKLKHA